MSQTQIPGVVLRGTGPDDHAGLRDFLVGLSPQTAYRRFCAGIGSPSSAFVRHLLAGGEDRGGWVAIADGRVLGHAFWARPRREADGAELAVVVADEVQGRGLGAALCRVAAMDAAAAGVTWLELHVLAENRPVHAMVARRWPGAVARREEGLAVYEVPLAARILQGTGPRGPSASTASLPQVPRPRASSPACGVVQPA